jgi:hypothetical protein
MINGDTLQIYHEFYWDDLQNNSVAVYIFANKKQACDFMNRATYYNYIEERLITLCARVELRGMINILDYHIHSENFYREMSDGILVVDAFIRCKIFRNPNDYSHVTP